MTSGPDPAADVPGTRGAGPPPARPAAWERATGPGGGEDGLPLERALWWALIAWALGGVVAAGATGGLMAWVMYEAFADEVWSPVYAAFIGIGVGIVAGALGAVTTTVVVLKLRGSRDAWPIVGTSVVVVLVAGPSVGAVGSLFGDAGALSLPVGIAAALLAPAGGVPLLRWLRRSSRRSEVTGPDPSARLPAWASPPAGARDAAPPPPPAAPRPLPPAPPPGGAPDRPHDGRDEPPA